MQCVNTELTLQTNYVDVFSPQDNEQVHCGELIGYVDNGAYSFAHKELPVVSSVLNEKYDTLEKWITENKM